MTASRSSSGSSRPHRLPISTRASTGCSRFLRIQSISTDRPTRRTAAQRPSIVARDLRSLGFEASVRPTEGHPVVVGKAATGKRNGNGAARPVLRPLRRAAGRSARSVEDAAVRAAHRNAAGRPQDHRRARRLRRQRPGDDLRRGLPRLQGGDRQAAARHHHDDRGRRGMRLEAPVRLRARQRGRVQARSRARLRHRHVGRRQTPSITTSLRGLVYEEVRLTCADRDLHSGLFGGAARNPIHVLARHPVGPARRRTARVTIPGFYDGVQELPADIKADLAGLI